jgi:hypothetical protein
LFKLLNVLTGEVWQLRKENLDKVLDLMVKYYMTDPKALTDEEFISSMEIKAKRGHS